MSKQALIRLSVGEGGLIEKAPDAYRTISEVADDLDIPQHVLRFWETRFGQIKPLKRGGGRRYYRPDDVDLLKGIRHLLYNEGYTIKGVQRILKEQGPRAVQAVAAAIEGRSLPPHAEAEAAPALPDSYVEEGDEEMWSPPPTPVPAPRAPEPIDFGLFEMARNEPPPSPPAAAPPPVNPPTTPPHAVAYPRSEPPPTARPPHATYPSQIMPPPMAHPPQMTHPSQLAQPPQPAARAPQAAPPLPAALPPAARPAPNVSYTRGGLVPASPSTSPEAVYLQPKRPRIVVQPAEPIAEMEAEDAPSAPLTRAEQPRAGLGDGGRRALQAALFELVECRRAIERVTALSGER